MRVRTISRWVPIASIIAVAPVRSSASSNCGIAVISLLLSATLTCPRLRRLFEHRADTKWRGRVNATAAAPHRLTVNSHMRTGWSQTHLADPVNEALLKGFGTERAEYTPKRVGRRNAILIPQVGYAALPTGCGLAASSSASHLPRTETARSAVNRISCSRYRHSRQRGSRAVRQTRP
jgi:hypothetical protein